MNLFKKVMRLFLAVAIMIVIAGCSQKSNQEAVSNQDAIKSDVHVAALKGPTGLSMLKLMDDSNQQIASTNNHFVICEDPTEIVAKISTGEIDVAALPTNMASILYQKTNQGIKMVAVNTLGMLSIVSHSDDIHSVADLRGRTVSATGQGATPQYAFEYILKENGLDPLVDLTVEYKSEHAELSALLLTGQVEIAMLPEPFVTQVTMKDPQIKPVLDLTKEWEKASAGKSILSMGCLIVRNEFVTSNKQTFDLFLNDYRESVIFTNTQIYQAAKLSAQYDIMPEEVAKNAIPNCNIVYMESAEMKSKTENFLQVLFEANPKSVGGKLPDDGFYYQK